MEEQILELLEKMEGDLKKIELNLLKNDLLMQLLEKRELSLSSLRKSSREG